MSVPPEFEAFYETRLRARAESLEPLRSALLGKYAATLACAVAAGAAGVILARPFGFDAFFAFLGPCLIVVAIGGTLTHRPRRDYVRRYKDEIVREVVAFLDGSLIYAPDENIPFGDFRRSGIVQKGIDRYSGDDLVRGTLGATALRFAEAHAEYKTEHRDKNGRTRETWHTIFRGLFLMADFNKHFKGSTYVLSDEAERLFGSLGKSLQSWTGPGQLVALEDADFEKEFVVYSSDQQEARYLLSPALMSRILELRRKSGRRVQLSFVDSTLFVALPFKGELFEPPIFSSLKDPELTRSYYEALRLAISIVEELNLNNRIWTKT